MDNLYSFFREIKRAALVVVLLLFAGIGNQAFAQANNVKPFTKRVGTTNPPNGVFNIRGDYTMIGNTNLTLQNYNEGTGDAANNSQNQMIYVDVDGVLETVNSSTAELVFSGENDADPNCSEIIYAGLYWSGRSNLTTDFTFDVTKGLIPGTPIVYSNQNQNFEHNGTVGSYQMVISRAGNSGSRRPVYTFSSDQGGDTYTFEVATNDVVTYRIGNGSTITPSNQVISTNTPSNSQTTISFSPVQIVDGDLTITVNSIVRHESDSESTGTYQSSGIVRTVLNGTFIPLVPNTVTLDKRQVKIKGPGDSGYTTLNATNSNILYPGSDQSHMFVGYTDVTAFVKARGVGEYTVADLALVEGNGGNTGYFGQWGIVVVYENTKLPWRDITLFDGYSFVQSPGNGALAEGILPITGFNAVQNGDVNVKLGVMAGEGDRGISGDFLEIEEGVNTNTWRRLVHPLTTSSNFFNSSIYTPVLNSSGTLVANPRFPNLLNNTGIDIAMWNIDNSDNEVIGNSQTSTRFKFGTTQDLYAIYFIAFAVDAYIPDIEGLNQIQKINGVDVTGNPNPTVEPGQQLEYKLEIRNKGTEAVENGEIIIPMPFTASFVSSTTQILFAPTNNQNAFYDPTLGSTGSIVWKIGDIPLPSDPNELLATLTYTLKATEDCFILAQANCEAFVSVNGEISGTGVTSERDFEGVSFVQGFEDGVCEGDPIREPLEIPFSGAAEFVQANCQGVPLVLDFEFCNVPETGIPVDWIRSSFPPGTIFYDGPNPQTATEFNENNPFPVDGGTFFGIPLNSSECTFPFEIKAVIVTTNPGQPATEDLTFCVGETAPNLNTIVVPSNVGQEDEYQLFFFTQAEGGNAVTGIVPSTTTAGEFEFWVAEGPSPQCLGQRVKIVVTVVAAPTLVITDPEPVCAPGTVNLTLPAITEGSSDNISLSYWLNPDATQELINPDQVSSSGTYYIKAENAAGCFVIKPVVVVINTTPAVPVVSSVTQPTCEEPTGTITVTEIDGVEFSIGGAYQESGVFSGLAPGAYTITARFVDGECISAGTTATVNAQPICSVSILKTLVQGSPNPVTEADQVLNYTVLVKNEGTQSLTNVNVTDELNGADVSASLVGPSGDTGNDGVLGIGEEWTYSYSYVVQQSDLDNLDEIVNVATVVTEETEPQSSTVITPISSNPSLSITKTVTTNDDVLEGDLTFDITVQNTGNVTLFNIYVEDIQTGDNWIINELAPNAIDTRSVTVEITQDLIDAGCYENTAIAEIREFVESQEVPGQSQENREFVVILSAEPSTVTECFTQSPDIELLKDGVFNDEDGDGFGDVGETITYTFTVTNIGNVTLSDITIEDDKVTVIGGPIASLAPGVSDDDTFTATYVLTQEDIDAGFVVNTALARGEAPGGDPEDPSDDITDESSDPTPVEEPSTECTTCTETEIPQNPDIELLKDGVFNDENGDGFGDVGETIAYTFTVTNTGNVTLSDITIEDDKVTVIGGPIASLAPGVSDDDTFTATYVLTQEDIDAGFVVNTALAEGTAPNGDVVEDESSDPTPVEEPSTDCETCTETEIPQNPDLEIVKTDNGAEVDAAGDVITYTLTATNTGNVTLINVTIEDPLTGLDENVGTLIPGQSVQRTTSYTVTQADVDSGFVLNTALTTGESPDGEDPSDDDEIETPVQRNPSLTIVKTDNGAEVDAAGDVITYTLTATNTGNVTLTNVTIEDPLTGLDENVGTLIPGQSVQRTTSYTVTQADVDAGFVLNTALTTGESPDGEDPSDEDEIETPVQRNPSLTIVKTDNGAEVDATGDVITYTLTATNTGNVTLTNVTIEDPLTGLDENVGTLIPGQSVQRTTSYTVTQADVDAGFVLNTALTTGESPDGEDPSDEDEIETPVQRNPSLTIVKTDNGAEVDAAGDVITYTLTATNTGNVTLTNVTIEDPLTGLDENVGTLIPGQSVQRTTSYTVTQADVDAGFVLNTALTTGESPDGEDPSDEDEIETPVQRNPSLTIVKTDNGAEVDAAGDVITYTLTATNTGNVTLTNVIITDPLTGLDENVGTLIPGQSVQRTTSYTVTQADVNAGFVLNTALTTGESPDGEDPSDEDEIETPISRTSDILITKVADVEGVQDEGEVINYTITVTNTGNTTLTNVSVEDPKTGLSEVIEVLEPGQAVSFETSYTVTIDDVAAQEAILNVATATYTDPVTEQERSEEAEELVEILCIDRTLITGTIFNDMTGEPLAGVPVTLIPQGSTPGTTKIVVTGADGRYSFKDFPAGSYLLQVQDANLNAARGLYPVESSLFFTDIDVCIYQTKDFGYETYDGPVLGDFVWYDLNGDGIQNEWFDANNDGQVTQNPIQGQAIDISEWEWFDLNGDGRYDGPENEGELNKAGFGNAQSANITVTGPNGYEEDVIVGIIGYWRSRPETGLGDYTATLTIDEFLDAEAQRMRGTGLIKVLPDAGARMMGINSTRTEVRCGVTTGNEIMRTVTGDQQVFLDMDFGIRCLDAEVEIIANDDDFGDHFISFGGVIGNILDNDLLEGQRPDPDDVDFEFTELDGIIGLLIDENGELSLIPGVNEVRSYTLAYTLRETLFPDNNDDALVFFRILNDNVDLSVTKTSFEAEIYEGDEFEYEIVVSNIGGTPATNVTIVDNLPASVTYLSSRVENVSSQQIQVGAPTVSGSTITWSVPFLPADGVITLRVRVKAGDAGSIQNVVVVDSEEEDTNVDNNTDTDVNQVLPFRIPNVITPNNDGDNDTFEIKGLGKFVASEIVIFNRYGDHVLEKENYRNDWNAPGQVAGTYFYVLKLTDRNGRVHEFKGWIQVIKE